MIWGASEMDFLVMTVLLGTSRISLGLLLAFPKWKDFLNSGFLGIFPVSSLPPAPPGSELRDRALPPSLELVVASRPVAPAPPGVRARLRGTRSSWVVDRRFRALAAANLLAFTKFFLVAPPTLRVALCVVVLLGCGPRLGEDPGGVGFVSAATAGDLRGSSCPPVAPVAPVFSGVFLSPSVPPPPPPPRNILLMKPFFSLAPSARG